LDLFAHETERDPHEEIIRLEEHIEEMDAKIESCRKFILASLLRIQHPIDRRAASRRAS
jgi:hypothetical protein